MAIITLVSATGSPGVTTCALGLALAWQRDVVLADVDAAASQAVLAGYLNGTATGGRGLTSLAQAFRDGVDLSGDLASHLISLTADGAPVRRWFLPGFARPGSARLFEPVWDELATAFDDLDRQGIDVIVDAGRWGPGLPAALLNRTRCLVFVTRSSLRALAALRLYVTDVSSALAGAEGCFPGLLVVGPSRPYSSGEIAKQFGLPVWAEVPWQVNDAATLSDGARSKSGSATRPLARSYAVAAGRLRGQAVQWESRLGRIGEVAHV